MSDFDGKVALVTGGGSGIGRCTSIALAKRGAKVLVVDRFGDKADAVAAEITASGGTASGFQCDVAKDAEVRAMVQTAVSRYGRLDFAVNNAGITGPIAHLTDYAMEDVRRVLDINLLGVISGMQEELKVMLAQGGGAIVNTASVYGFVTNANFVAYTASKHGVIGATKSVAVEVATKNIRVNAIAPGYTETPIVTEEGIKLKRGTEAYAAAGREHAMNRMGQPEEMAEGIVWLLSDAASFVTGTCLMIDGGLTLR